MSYQQLPSEIKKLILSELSVTDILRLCGTDRLTKQICDSEIFWRAIYERDFGELSGRKHPKVKYIHMLLKRFATKAEQKARYATLNIANTGLHSDDYAELRDNMKANPLNQIGPPLNMDIEEITMIKDKLADYWYWSRLALSALGYDSDIYRWYGNRVGYDFANFIDIQRQGSNKTDIEALINWLIVN